MHSPEPWRWHENADSEGKECPAYCEHRGGFKDANGEMVCWFGCGESYDQTAGSPPAEADIHRIVACVNACAGIPTEELIRSGLGRTTVALETLDMLARFYQQGGLDTVPANCQVTPRIHYEATSGYTFFGKMLNPKSWNNCQAAISVCRNAGYKVTNPDGTEET